MSTTNINSTTTENKRNLRSTHKRRLEAEDNQSNQVTNAKKKKAYKMSNSEMDELKNILVSMKGEIENKISVSQSSIESKINELTQNVNTEVHELKSSVDELKSKLSTDIDSIKNHISEHKQRLDNNEDDIKRLKLSADLRLNGIPFKENENFIELFHKIAITIGYDCSNNVNVPFMKRILMRNKLTGKMTESSTISLHFSSIQQKEHFYSMYLSKMPLKPENIDLQKDLKIFIGESLTQVNAQIFKYALGMKKEKKVAQVFTVDGLVKVKFVKGPQQRAHTIRHNMQLDTLLKEFEQQQQQQQTPTQPMETNQDGINNGANTSIESLPNVTQTNATHTNELHQQALSQQQAQQMLLIQQQQQLQQQHQQKQRQQQHSFQAFNAQMTALTQPP